MGVERFSQKYERNPLLPTRGTTRLKPDLDGKWVHLSDYQAAQSRAEEAERALEEAKSVAAQMHEALMYEYRWHRDRGTVAPSKERPEAGPLHDAILLYERCEALGFRDPFGFPPDRSALGGSESGASGPENLRIPKTEDDYAAGEG